MEAYATVSVPETVVNAALAPIQANIDEIGKIIGMECFS